MDLQPGPLRTLQAVARFSGFSQAATHLALTQPAVSMQIRQLEHAARALAGLARAVERLHGLRGVVAGPVRLGRALERPRRP